MLSPAIDRRDVNVTILEFQEGWYPEITRTSRERAGAL